MPKERPYKDFLERLAGKYGKIYYPFVNDEARLKETVEKDFPGFSLHLDSRLNFTPDNHPEFCEHAPYTVRYYAPNIVRLPKHPENNDFLDAILIADDKKEKLGVIRIGGEVAVWYAKNFPSKAAQLCGFDDKRHMMWELSQMYRKDMLPDDVLSLYEIGNYYSLKK
jgi:hypothetical protein